MLKTQKENLGYRLLKAEETGRYKQVEIPVSTININGLLWIECTIIWMLNWVPTIFASFTM